MRHTLHSLFALLVLTFPTFGVLVKYDVSPDAVNDERKVLMLWENENIDFTFALISDSQIGMYDTYQLNGDGSDYKTELENVKLMIEKLEKIEPKLSFIILTGDIVNQKPFGTIETKNREYDPDMNKIQNDEMKTVFEKTSLPVFVMPGNHDLGNDFNKTSLDNYYKNYGSDHYYFTRSNTAFVTLSTQHFNNDFEKVPEMEIYCENQWSWIEKTFANLAANDNVHSVVVSMHIPIYLESVEEDETYDTWDIGSRKRFVDLVNSYFSEKSTKTVYQFSGHTHRGADTSEFIQNSNAITTSLNVKTGDWEMKTDGGVRLVKNIGNELEHFWYHIDEIPAEFNSCVCHFAGILGVFLLFLR